MRTNEGNQLASNQISRMFNNNAAYSPNGQQSFPMSTMNVTTPVTGLNNAQPYQPPIMAQPSSSSNEIAHRENGQMQVIQEHRYAPRFSQMPVEVLPPLPITNTVGASRIVTQPMRYMMSDVARGLEYLASLDQVFIKQRIELLEVFFGCETKNKYEIYDAHGQQMLYAKEDTECCNRNCCGSSRQFDMNIMDGHGENVIHLHRPLACQSCCFPCCLQTLQVFSPPGNLIGTVEQEWNLFLPKFRVKDAAGEEVLYIQGPFWTSSCCGNDVKFQVLGQGRKTEVGRILKKWSGFEREVFTDADNFGVSFPVDLDVKMKAVLLGATLLIDFMYFESR